MTEARCRAFHLRHDRELVEGDEVEFVVRARVHSVDGGRELLCPVDVGDGS